MKKKENILLILCLAAMLACGCLWLIQLLQDGAFPAAYPGLLCTVTAVIAAAVLFSSQRRRIDMMKQAHQKDIAELEQKNEQALAEMRSQNRSEMDAFRSSLSHSLRMPVAIIQGYAELLASGVIKDADVAAEYLEKINQRSQYMTEAISRQFSAADTMDSSKLTYSDLNLITLVQQAAADMQTAAKEKGIRIQVISSEEQLSMRGDIYLLNRVLFNLLENALKYMGRPGVITIRVLSREGVVSLLIQDDGLGLPSDETARIFEPNYQGSNHSGGQGYGLYLVRRAVEAHGGTVSAQSAPGQGMGISITLPLAERA